MMCPECEKFLDKEIDKWHDVSFFLYLGLADRMDWYLNHIEKITDKKYKDLEKAVKVYSEKCIISSSYLEEKLEQINKLMFNQ